MNERAKNVLIQPLVKALVAISKSPLSKVDSVFSFLWALGHESQLSLREEKLSSVEGVIHIGASTGQELDLYQRVASRVLWIEAIPEVHEALERKILNSSAMESAQSLVWSKSGETLSFNLASNDMHSSSVFQLESDNGFTGVEMTKSIELITTTLDDLIASREEFWSQCTLHLVIDVQGAELEVLLGATATLSRVASIQVEVSTFPVYVGGAQLEEIDSLLRSCGFKRISKCGEKYHGDAMYVRR